MDSRQTKWKQEEESNTHLSAHLSAQGRVLTCRASVICFLGSGFDLEGKTAPLSQHTTAT